MFSVGACARICWHNAAAFTLPVLTANSLVLAYLAASTLPALTAPSRVLTYTGVRPFQVGNKKACVGAGQGAKM